MDATSATGVDDDNDPTRRRAEILGEHGFRTLFGGAPFGIALVESRRRLILDCNEVYAQIIGRTIGETRGVDWADITHPDDREQSVANSERWVAAGQRESEPVVKRYLRPDGSAVLVSLKSAVVAHDGSVEQMHLSMIEDITDRTLADERLADSERRYKLLADHAGDVVLLVRNGVIEWLTPSMMTMLGYAPETLLGTQTLAIIHPDDAASVREGRARLNAGQQVRVRCRFLHADGRWVWMEYTSRPLLRDDGTPEGSAVSTLWNIQAEVEAREALAAAEAERHALEASIQQATRLESLGVLAGGVAHDFNNILVGILGNTELALAQLPVDSPVRALLDAVASSATRASDLTRQLLDYAGHRPFDHRGPVDPLQVIRETMELVAPLMPRSASIVVDLPDRLPSIGCDRGQLQQVIMNLVINAADALDAQSGQIVVRTRVRHLDRSEVTRLAPTDPPEPGEFVEISVADDGIGMDEATVARVLEPFFTTKAEGRGLGLAAVYGIVRSNGGAIEVESEPGRGTTFRVHLPSTGADIADVDHTDDTEEPGDTTRAGKTHVAGDAPEAGGDADETAEGRGDAAVDGGRGSALRVLLVDDDDDVRQVCELMLRASEFEVESCSSGRRAIELVTERPDRVDVILLDMSMPEMRGEDVLRAVRAIAPDLPAVLMSGFSAVNLQAELADLTIQGFVQKPFRPSQIVAAVRAAVPG